MQMPEKITKSVRLPTDVAEEIEQQADEQGLSESDLLRRCIEKGLADDDQSDRLDRIDDRLSHIEQMLKDDNPLTVSDDVDDLARAAIDDLGKSWKGDVLDVRIDALSAAYQYLREEGSASKSDFTDNVYPDYPGGYGTSDGGWWRSLIRPGLAEMPGTVKPQGGGEWQFVEN